MAGVELEARHGLGFLLPQLEHFHAGGNLSLVRSEVNIDSTELKLRRALDPQAADTRQLQGQSPFLINLDLSYDNFATGTAGRHLLQHLRPALGGSQSRRNPGRVRGSARHPRLHLLAAVAEYKIKLSAKNLLDSSFEKAYRYQDNDYISSQYYKGRSFSISVSYNR